MTTRNDIYKHHRALMNFAMQNLNGNIEEAENLVQDAYVLALECFDKFDEDKAPLKWWLMEKLRWAAASKKKKQSRKKRSAILTPIEDEAYKIQDNGALRNFDDSDKLHRDVIKFASSKMNPTNIKILLLFYDGVKVKEIARQVGLTRTGVSDRIYRCKRKLKKILINSPYFETLKNDGYI